MLTKNTTINNDDEIDDFNDFSFEYTNELIELANQMFLERKLEMIIIGSEFEDEEWRLVCQSRHKSYVINFNDYIDQIRFFTSNYQQIVFSLKCWFILQLPNRSVESLKKYLDYLFEFICTSKLFDKNIIENVRDYLNYECSDTKRWNLIIPTLNYLDFYDDLDSYSYRKMLSDIKKEINMENVGGKVRKLPSSQDVLAFSNILNEYFSKLTVENKDYINYYPVFLWWQLSNLIPMRPSEFCAIERESVFIENENFYIKLPRKKQRNKKHKVQIIDKIQIPKEVFMNLQEYILATKKYGRSITLISPKSTFNNRKNSIGDYKDHRFTYCDLQYILYKFYKEVIDKNDNFKYNDRIKLGDTRHFAFLNLMRQGYHPVEIARLGGHTSLHAQYHYQQHLDYWVDVEIVQLMYRFNHNKNKSNLGKDSNYNQIYLDDTFINEKVLKPSSTEFKMELDIGFCTDPIMNCQTDHHFYCEHWRISPEEFSEKKEFILNEFKHCKNEIDRLTSTLKNLFLIALNESLSEEDLGELNIEFNKDLHFAKNDLDAVIHKATKLYSIIQNKGV
ncbi:MAG: site-specific integrase [Bacillota bacterium]